MTWLGDFDHRGFTLWTGEFSAAANAGVGTLHALDRQHGAAFDDDGLTNIEAADLPGDAQPEGNLFLLLRSQFRAGDMAGGRDRIAQPRGGLDQLDSILLQLVGDGAENGVRVASFELQ